MEGGSTSYEVINLLLYFKLESGTMGEGESTRKLYPLFSKVLV